MVKNKICHWTECESANKCLPLFQLTKNFYPQKQLPTVENGGFAGEKVTAAAGLQHRFLASEF